MYFRPNFPADDFSANLKVLCRKLLKIVILNGTSEVKNLRLAKE